MQDNFGKDVVHKYFSRNGFDNKWAEVIEKNLNLPKWDKLRKKGRRTSIVSDAN